MPHALKTLTGLLALGLLVLPAAHAQVPPRPDGIPLVRLPDPPVDDDAPASAFITAARIQLAARASVGAHRHGTELARRVGSV